MSRRSSTLLKLAALALSAALSALILELGWRVFLVGPDAFSFEKMNSVRYIGVSGLLQRAEFPEVAYELKPNLDTYHNLAPLRTNSRGLHDVEYALEPPPDTFRAVVLGDSYTTPSGVALEDAFHTRLEDRLGRQFPERRYEFVNFGVPGYSLRQYVAVLRHKALAYRPDLVLVGFCGRNDHHIHPESTYTKPYEPLEVYNPFFHLTFLEQVRLAWKYKVAPRLGQPDPEKKGASDAPPYMEEMFDQLQALSASAGARLAVVLIDTRRSSVSGKLAAILEARGIPFLDTSSYFHDKDPDDYGILRTDEHPNAEAHRIIADQLHDFLVERGLVTGDARG